MNYTGVFVNQYCTYLTSYSGNKLPPFYIGYTSVEKIHNGYRGTVTSIKYKKIWQSELKNNPSLFKTQIITTHETISEAKERETLFHLQQNVAKSPMFINMHIQDHNFCIDRTGMLHSEDTKEKMKQARRGHSPVPRGTNLSEQHKAKIGQALKGRTISPETIAKRSASRLGKKNVKRFSNESNLKRSTTLKAKMTNEKRAHLSERFTGKGNGFFGKTHSLETRAKMSGADRSYLKGLYWWSDGTHEIRAYESPGELWARGRLPKS